MDEFPSKQEIEVNRPCGIAYNDRKTVLSWERWWGIHLVETFDGDFAVRVAVFLRIDVEIDKWRRAQAFNNSQVRRTLKRDGKSFE